MTDDSERLQAEILYQEVRSIWEHNAAFWDEAMGEGNKFQRELIAPAAERLLNIEPGQLVLDAACGNGVFSRRLAQLGALVVACDFSSTFIQLARERSSEYASRIEYHVVDVTDTSELLALGLGPEGPRKFDAVYCGMAIQDMVDIQPLFAAAATLVKQNGCFVFSIPHPSFNNAYIRKVVEEEDREGTLIVQQSVKITGYIQPRIDKGLGIIGQPVAQYYFHRPLSQIYQTAFQHGFVLDGIEEPVFGPDVTGNRPLSWGNFKEIPPVLVSRMRLRL